MAMLVITRGYLVLAARTGPLHRSADGGLALEFWGDREAAGSPSGSPRKKIALRWVLRWGIAQNCPDMSQNLMMGKFEVL